MERKKGKQNGGETIRKGGAGLTVVHVLLELVEPGGDAALAVDALHVEALHLYGRDEAFHHHGDAHLLAHQAPQGHAKHLAPLLVWGHQKGREVGPTGPSLWVPL